MNVSMTMLRHFNACPRSGKMYEDGKRAGIQNIPMVRGSALHTIMERCTQAMLETGEVSIPGDLAKGIVDEVLAEYHVPIEEHDYLRECAYRWAGEWEIRTPNTYAERLFVLDIDGWQVRCKIDFLEVNDGIAYIADYKSGRGALAAEDVGRKRSDGTIAGKNFQLVLYALAVMFGTVDGEPLAKGCQEVIAEFVYPGIEDRQGLMLRRPCSFTRVELLEYRESLIAILKRLTRCMETDDWPALVSEQGCSECPSPQQCPIPVERRDYAGTINTVGQAATALERRFVQKKLDAALTREIKAFAKANELDGIQFGNGMEIAFVYSETERFDKDGYIAAMEEGRPSIDFKEFISVSKSTRFAERTVEEDK